MYVTWQRNGLWKMKKILESEIGIGIGMLILLQDGYDYSKS